MTRRNISVFMRTMVAPRQYLAPAVAHAIAHDFYAIESVATALTGERDENFMLAARDGRAYMLKVASAFEDPAVTRMQIEALLHLERVDPALPCPRVCRTIDGSTDVTICDPEGTPRLVRMVSWLPGAILRNAKRSQRQRAACGHLAAGMGRALRAFDHPAAHRDIAWDLRNVPMLRPLLEELPALPCKEFIREFIDWFECKVTPELAGLRRQFIHNDFNDRNILVNTEVSDLITGIIDFGDAVNTALVSDVAIAAVAHITGLDSAESEVEDLARAYHAIEPLLPAEQDILGPLVAARIVTGVLIPSWHRARNPAGEHYDPLDEPHIARRIAFAQRLMRVRFALG